MGRYNFNLDAAIKVDEGCKFENALGDGIQDEEEILKLRTTTRLHATAPREYSVQHVVSLRVEIDDLILSEVIDVVTT